MFKRFILFILILVVVTGLSCSKASDPVVKADSKDSVITGYDKGAFHEELPIPRSSYYMGHMIERGVEMYYCAYGRVPSDFEELKQSGLLMAIPRCPISGEFYTESIHVSVDTPSHFSYTTMSDKSYSYSYVEDVGGKGNLEVINVDYLNEYWEQALIFEGGRKKPVDAKIEMIGEFFPSVFGWFYHDNKRLPENPSELLADFQLIEEAWRSPIDGEGAYYEFGVDHVNNKMYHQFKYTFGFGRTLAQKVDTISMTVKHEGEESFWDPNIETMLIQETYDPDVLILNPWFTLDNLESVYLEITDR